MPGPDTIVAMGTPPGLSALAILRLSGPGSFKTARAVCPDLPPTPEPRRATLSRALDPETGEELDQVLVTFFPGPNSYTGEDMVEISSHGGWLSPALILDVCQRSGARPAEEGEFTRRAYLNGKMDLLQAEAVVDLIEARSRALHGTAVRHLERSLSARIGEIREGMVTLEALLVHHLDFPEEDEPPVPLEEIAERAEELEEDMARLLRTAPEGELLREGAQTVLAGRPNSGKSSLFNALIGEERAIVTEIPGTTRDALEAVVSLGGYPFRLVDTAGFREAQEDMERVERMGVEVARRYLESADVVLFCAEAGRDLEGEEKDFLAGLEDRPVVKVRTKLDLTMKEERERGTEEGEVWLSVRTGEGLDRLRELLPALVFKRLVQGGADVPVLTRRRQAAGVLRAMEEVGAFRQALAKGIPAEMAATHLRPAETALEELLGVIPREEILDRLFRDFCIGK